jgi:hypothetical protein
MLVKVRWREVAEDGDGAKRTRAAGVGSEEGSEDGVARTCWTFFMPASWVRTEGQAMAAERSIW